MDEYAAIQVVMMPSDVNPRGTIFGGVILSYLDQAGVVGGRRAVMQAGGPEPMLVTVAINRVEFKQPVLVGDVVRFIASVVKYGTSSVTMRVRVEAERGTETLQVTEAELVYVNVSGPEGHLRPTPLFPGKA